MRRCVIRISLKCSDFLNIFGFTTTGSFDELDTPSASREETLLREEIRVRPTR